MFLSMLKHFSVIIILSAVLYIPAMNAPFVYDDGETIIKNPYIKSLEHIPAYFNPRNAKMWSSHERQRQFYRPIPLLTFALNYHISGLKPLSYHCLNLLIHILTALSVYVAVCLSAKSLAGPTYANRNVINLAFVSSLLFSVHPLQTESVTYVVSRSIILCSFFLLWSFIAFIWAYNLRIKYRSFFRLVSLTFFVFSLLSKEVAIVFPFLILLYSLIYAETSGGSMRWRKIAMANLPYFVALAVYLFMRVLFLGKATMSSLLTPYWGHYFATALKAVLIYLRLLLIPTGQNVDHFLPIVNSVFELWSIIAFILLVVVLWLLFGKVLAYSKFLFFWGMWYIIALFPNLFLPTSEPISEHSVYFPSIGFFVVFADVGSRILSHYSQRVGNVEKLLRLGLVSAIVVQLMLLTLNRNLVWQDDMLLWRDAVNKSFAKDRPHLNLGLAYANKGLLEEAISEFRIALSLNPHNAAVLNNLGIMYSKMGMLQEAENAFTRSIELEQINPDAYNNLGFFLVTKGQYPDAIPILDRALTLRPDCSATLANLGYAYIKSDQKEKGCGYLESGVRINPDDIRARLLYKELCIK